MDMGTPHSCAVCGVGNRPKIYPFKAVWENTIEIRTYLHKTCWPLYQKGNPSCVLQKTPLADG